MSNPAIPLPADEGADYVPNAEIAAVARQLIARHAILQALTADLRIAYLERLGEPSGEGEEAIAKCQKAGPLWRDLADVDVVIWAWGWWWQQFAPRQREALVLHELCHIGRTEKGGVKLRKHDLEEFAFVAAEYGAWDASVETFVRALEHHGATQVVPIDRGPKRAGGQRRTDRTVDPTTDHEEDTP